MVAAAFVGLSAAASVPAAGDTAGNTATGGRERHPAVAVAAVGDTILGNTPTLPESPRRYLDAVRRALTHDADVVFANLEGTLTDETHSKCGSGSSNCYAFRNPPSYGDVFADLGFTALSTANNHSHDFGSAGYQETRAVIDRNGMTGSGAPGEVRYFRTHTPAGSVRFALVA
ncbi:MAG: hypothetical protein QOH75_3713, partial [Actinomycetota bacterium]|nr:hypothetical protein [Actinomycetota bacterium]